MSATGRGVPREPHDYYATPSWCVHRFLERVELPGRRWLEPCAGGGALIRAAHSVRPDVRWHAIELRAECASPLEEAVGGERTIANYLARPSEQRRYDAVVTNPPYSLAHEFLARALQDAPYVAMLLRLNYLGSAKRAAFFRQMPPDVYVLPNRPSFARGHMDSCEYGWFVWGPQRIRSQGLVSVLDTTPRAERIRERLLRERLVA